MHRRNRARVVLLFTARLLLENMAALSMLTSLERTCALAPRRRRLSKNMTLTLKAGTFAFELLTTAHKKPGSDYAVLL